MPPKLSCSPGETPARQNSNLLQRPNPQIPRSGRNRFGSIRLGSGFFENRSVRFGSVRKFSFPGSTRFGLRFSDASWLGPVRFGSASGSGRFQNYTVRSGSAGSVRFLIHSCRLLFLLISYSFLFLIIIIIPSYFFLFLFLLISCSSLPGACPPLAYLGKTQIRGVFINPRWRLYMCIYIYTYICTYIYTCIYIYIYNLPGCLPTKSLGFRGFDASRLLILRGGNSHVRMIL